MGLREMSELSLAGLRVLIREDLNVPISDGAVVSDARILSALPTIEQALSAGASVLLMSHLGRPEEGKFDAAYTLAPVAKRLQELLGREVPLLSDLDDVTVKPGSVALLENVRFLAGEKANSDELARGFARLCDVFVMDAFATAHRAHASTHGVAKFAGVACAGPLLARELAALEQALRQPTPPMIAIVGGAKVSTKLEVLHVLADMVEHIIVGGGIANTFIAAAGYPVGQSLYEPDLVGVAQAIAAKVDIPLPVDVMVGKRFAENEIAVLKALEDIEPDDMIMDVGPETARQFAAVAMDAATILWNGPLGVFEFDQFGEGTRVLAEAIAASDGFSIAGGGDTLAAIEKYEVGEGISYLSTGGGAFLEFVEGKRLPAVAILEERAVG
ncbi:MAG: phosphoglycerate kinase [Gammaproteobacteria bacterium]|nr:phosphoglycerate kinase [Gammaproteobacteria bacterium]